MLEVNHHGLYITRSLDVVKMKVPCVHGYVQTECENDGNIVLPKQARPVRQSAAENLGELTRMSVRVDPLAADLAASAHGAARHAGVRGPAPGASCAEQCRGGAAGHDGRGR